MGAVFSYSDLNVRVIGFGAMFQSLMGAVFSYSRVDSHSPTEP